MLDSGDYIQASRIPSGQMPELDVCLGHSISDSEDVGNAALRVGLIDGHRLSQECLAKAFAELPSEFEMVAFSTVRDCILAGAQNLDLVLYYNHASGMTGMIDISTIRRSLPDTLLIILSDAEDAEQPHVICSAVKQGARGFIPTQAIGIPMIAAAIRLVWAGGTYAPLDLLLSLHSSAQEAPATRAQSPLTSRELMVLGHVHQGKANKMIAYELGMKESTVKVHVRHIMRKTGASNRVQAAYTARNLWDVLPAHK